MRALAPLVAVAAGMPILATMWAVKRLTGRQIDQRDALVVLSVLVIGTLAIGAQLRQVI